MRVETQRLKPSKIRPFKWYLIFQRESPGTYYISGNAGVGKTALAAAMAKNINAISGKEYEQRTVLYLQLQQGSEHDPGFLQ